jgi:hypothetical protein
MRGLFEGAGYSRKYGIYTSRRSTAGGSINLQSTTTLRNSRCLLLPAWVLSRGSHVLMMSGYLAE